MSPRLPPPRSDVPRASTPGPVDCARAVWRETLSWVPFGAAPPQAIRLSPPIIPSKPPRSSSPGTTMLGQSPLTRAHCGGGAALARSLDRARSLWRCGGGGSVRLHRPSRVLCAPRLMRARAYVITAYRARHPRFPSPSTHACARCALRRRSLARSIAHVRCGGGDGGLAVGHAARHTHHALRASRARTCASSTGDTRAITVPSPPRAHACAEAEAALARSLDCARAVWRETPSWVPFGAAPLKSPDSPPPTILSKPPRSSSPGTTMLGQSPLTRTHCGIAAAAALARSLDRARSLWRWRQRSVTPPVTRVTRATRHAHTNVHHHRASRASSPFSVPPVHDRHARAAAAAALTTRALICAHAVWRW